MLSWLRQRVSGYHRSVVRGWHLIKGEMCISSPDLPTIQRRGCSAVDGVFGGPNNHQPKAMCLGASVAIVANGILIWIILTN